MTDVRRRRAAVLGSPDRPLPLPGAAPRRLRGTGPDGWTYDRFEVDEAALPGFLDGLGPEWAGLSLTMPLKRAVIPLLDEISDTAASVEAVNTVVFTEDGRRIGDNTDIPGMVAALRERGVDKVDSRRRPRRGRHRLLRAGRARPDLHRRGHRVRPQRGPRRRDAAVGRAARRRRCAPPTGRTRPRRCARRWSSPPPRPAPPTHLAAAVPERPGTLFDVLYDPWPTALAAAWSARGGAVVGGLDLLVHQAVLQVEQMTGRAPGARSAAMRAAGEAGARRAARPAAPLRRSASAATVGAVRLLDRRPVARPDVGGSEVAGQGRAPGRAVAVVQARA